MGDDMIRIEYRNIMRKIKICSSDDAVAVLAQHDRHFVTLLELENDTLQISKGYRRHLRERHQSGIFVDDARNLSFRRGEATMEESRIRRRALPRVWP